MFGHVDLCWLPFVRVRLTSCSFYLNEMVGIDWDLFSSYVGLLGLATLSIYAGSFSSLPRSRRKSLKKEPNKVDEDEEEEEIERMSSDDAWLFPIIGSVALFGLYGIVKYFGTAWINWFLGWYFSIAGIGSVWKSSTTFTRWFLGDTRWRSFDHFTFIVQKNGQPFSYLILRTPTLILLPLSFIPSLLYNLSASSRKSVLLTDILGLSFSHNALSLLKIDSFKTGTILLSGLFLYDVWWVFGTEVMVKVATSLDVPIKLLWPKSLLLSSERGYTMLGLGDIVIPGTFVALALRYDYNRENNASSDQPKKKFPKPYFFASILAYILGLVTTMTVMHVFHTAQPALLYLNPACILSFVITALYRGELKEAWMWNDEPKTSNTGTDAGKQEMIPDIRKSLSDGNKHQGDEVSVKITNS